MGIPANPEIPSVPGDQEQRSPNAVQRRILQSSPLRKSVASHQQMLSQNRRKNMLVKRACAVKSRATNTRTGIRVLPRRTCDKDLPTRNTRQWMEPKVEQETRRAKVHCSSPAVAEVLRSIEEERAERARFVMYGTGLPDAFLAPKPPQTNPQVDSLGEQAAGEALETVTPSLSAIMRETLAAVFSPPDFPTDGSQLVGPKSHLKRGLEHDRRMKHEEFVRSTRLVKFRHSVATPMGVPRVHDGKLWWHVGDVISVRSQNSRTYYALIRDFFCDQYGVKSCLFTWLVPKKGFRRERHDAFFDPKKFELGFEDPEPRKLSFLKWVCRAPSDLFCVSGSIVPSYHVGKGFVWTAFGPVEVGLDEVERAVEEGQEVEFVKKLERVAEKYRESWEESPSEMERVKERVSALLELKSRQLKEQASRPPAPKPEMKFGEVRTVRPEETAFGEELCLMTKKTYEAMISKNKDDLEAFFEARYGSFLPPLAQATVEQVEVMDQQERVQLESEPMEEDERITTADEVETDEDEPSLEFCEEMVVDESGKEEEEEAVGVEEDKLDVLVAGCEPLPDWQKRSEDKVISKDGVKTMGDSLSSLKATERLKVKQDRVPWHEKSSGRLAEECWPSFMADHIYSRPPSAAEPSVVTNFTAGQS